MVEARVAVPTYVLSVLPNSTEAGVLSCIADRYALFREEEPFFVEVSLESMGIALNKSERTIYRAIEALVKKDFLTLYRQKTSSKVTYCFRITNSAVIKAYNFTWLL
jgi:hypothetical protein